MIELLREFKPALFFLGKFLAIYLLGNVLYGLFIESYGNRPDPLTAEVTEQTCWILNTLGETASMEYAQTNPFVALQSGGETVVSIFEGCNGVNVLIIFLAFLFAFGGSRFDMIWFGALGIMVVHLVNLGRIIFLYFIAQNNPANFYYFHKYFFTAILYVVVFTLWVFWIMRFQRNHVRKQVA